MQIKFLGQFYAVVNITFVEFEIVVVTYQAGNGLKVVTLNRREFLDTVSTVLVV
jgi:hypothetical protein